MAKLQLALAAIKANDFGLHKGHLGCIAKAA
jgi:hypothetical protein